MIPLRDSMVDVQSPQQALRAYSSAKEYACGILCDARCGESNRRGDRRPAHGRAARSPGPGAVSPATPGSSRHRTTRTQRSVPERSADSRRDESRLGHNPISTLRDHFCVRESDIPRTGCQSLTSPGAGRRRAGLRAAAVRRSSPPPAAPPPRAAASQRAARNQARLRCRWTSASQVKPIPPCTWRQSRALRTAASSASSLAAAMSSGTRRDGRRVHRTSGHFRPYQHLRAQMLDRLERADRAARTARARGRVAPPSRPYGRRCRAAGPR